MLFSATQTRNVEDLARISLKEAPLYVGVDDNKETATVEGLEQVRSLSWSFFFFLFSRDKWLQMVDTHKTCSVLS